MLTPNALERASQAFRKGYQDGYELKHVSYDGYPAGSFAWFDYQDGLKAGENDRNWTEKRIAKK